MATTPLLSGIGLRLGAGGAPLTEAFDFALGSGEGVVVVGPSGCGKTTLLRVLCGLEDPLAGQLRFRGSPPEDVGWPAFRRQVTYVAQQPAVDDQEVGTLLARPFGFAASTDPFDLERAQDLLVRIGLAADLWNRPSRDLSVGQQQRVCLVRALLLDSACLLLDEPTASLDEDAARATENLILEASRERGAGFVVVTHDRRLAERLCARLVDFEPWTVRPPVPVGDDD